LLVLCFLVIAGQFFVLAWLAPRYVVRMVESAVGGTLQIRHARLSFPLAMEFTGVSSANRSTQSFLVMPRVVIKPRWLSVTSRTVKLDQVIVERPLLRVMRSAAGEMVWPPLATQSPLEPTAAPQPFWRVQIRSLVIDDGAIEFLDQQIAPAFRGVLHHLSVDLGPLTLPGGGPQTSFAVRGEFVGHSGEAAPLYCSGWAVLTENDFQASCQLQSLALSAFEPYYQQGNVQLRVYSATLKSTSQWLVDANAFEGRVQMELGNLKEGDLSIHGRTVVDVKKLAAGEAPRMTAELKIAGPLNQPEAWRSEFVPGDTAAQQLVRPLLERGIEMITIPFGGQKIKVSLTLASPSTMTGIEEASKQVEQELEILATPATEPVAPVTAPAEATPPAPTEGAPPSPVPPPSPAPPPAPSSGS
jgi:hypothetical protein